ncbi:hypothetical protein [Clostridium sp.]|jgi:hypothetical protein|uniref:hypothetical protein n=1 Tax=Clostridium sp. TaxID=1506 RepID=UPI003EEC4278
MSIHENRKKEVSKLCIIGLCLALSTSTLIACSNKNIIKNEQNISENDQNIITKDSEIKDGGQIETNKTTKIAFEKNDNVYIYDEINEQIESLGDNLKSKDLLNISPDNTKLIFREFNKGEPVYPPHVTVYDIKTEVFTDIVIDNKNVQQIVDMEWIDNENILFTGHINPSSSGYSVYNIESRKELISCVGTVRDITISKKNILYSNTPHVFPQISANLYINGNKVFESQDVNEKILDGVLSEDGKSLAFRSWVANENELNSEVTAYLNVAKINSHGKSLSDLKRINIGGDISGDIKFDDKNNLTIIGDEYIYKLKENTLFKEENILPQKEAIPNDSLQKFKRILAEQFPEEFISEQTILDDIGIYNLIVFQLN